MAVSRRVSFILPGPNETSPLLQLPPLGERRRGFTQPYLVPKGGLNGDGEINGFASRNPFAAASTASSDNQDNHPRHCLGITSLALDTSTLLSNSSTPGGILYTGGRDGLVASWELGMLHKRRRGGRYEILPGRGGGRVKWEKVGDGAEMWDDEDEEEDEDVEPASGGGLDVDEDEEGWSSEDEMGGDEWVGVDGDRVAEGMRKRRAVRGEVPYEDRWEIDHDALARTSPPPTTFRQSSQTHTDWVNAMLLCNLNQTIITASSDRTIRAWSSHSSPHSSPTLIGRHRDYVRSLAWAKYPSLLFSGALDRQVAVWDVSSPNPEQPLLQIDLNKADDWGGVGMEGERGSVYALGVDPAGKVLAAGTPERVVRLWDPRVGDKTIGKLIGHSDCVRSIVVSDDGKYMLTGSSDTTIKLWSLAAHRCLHTFNHHTSSVWALHSNHPNLERFYSGSRDGIVCAVDVEQVTDISDGECVVLAREAGDGVLRRGDYETKSGDEGIRCIVGMDDEYIWTATGSAEVKRWRDVGRRVNRTTMTEEDDGTSYAPISNGDDSAPVGSGLEGRFNPVPITDGTLRNKRLSLEGDASGLSPLLRTESRESRTVAFAPTPSPRAGQSDNTTGSLGQAALRDRLVTQARRANLSGASIADSVVSDSSAMADDGPMPIPAHSMSMNGIPYESLVCLGLPDSPYSLGFSHAHRSGEIHEARSVSSMPRGPSRGSMVKTDGVDQNHGQLAREEFEDREVASEAIPLRKTPDEVIYGRPGLVRSIILNDRQHVLTVDTEGEVAAWNIVRGHCVGRFSAAEVAAALDLERGVKAEMAVRKHSMEVLEMVRDRIEGETMVITWCQVDTRIGSLVVHLEEGRVFDAEVYADEMGLDKSNGLREDTRLNLGKWALANLFKGLIAAEERGVIASSPETTTSSLPSLSRSPEIRYAPLERGPAAYPHRQRAATGSFSAGNGTPFLNIPGIATPASTPAVLPDIESTLSKSAPATSGWQSFHAFQSGALSAIPQSPATNQAVPATSPLDLSGRGDHLSMNNKPKDPSPSRANEEKQPSSPSGTTSAPIPTPSGSMMGKLKGFGKKKKAETPMLTVLESTETATFEENNAPKVSEREAEQLRILDTVRSHAFHPPAPWEAPPVAYPPSTQLLISEESKDAGAWVVTYRSQVGSTETDMEALELNSPMWLLDYLFTSRTKIKDPVKLTFILEPVPGCGMKEMPEGTTRLSASRILRTKKIMAFIFDKLDLGPARARAGSIASAHSRITALASRRSSAAPTSGQALITENTRGTSPTNFDPGAMPEETIELLCGDHVVDPKMTLATLKQYYGSGGDMLLHYRPKKGVTLG